MLGRTDDGQSDQSINFAGEFAVCPSSISTNEIISLTDPRTDGRTQQAAELESTGSESAGHGKREFLLISQFCNALGERCRWEGTQSGNFRCCGHRKVPAPIETNPCSESRCSESSWSESSWPESSWSESSASVSENSSVLDNS
jgi:hypothetical protein